MLSDVRSMSLTSSSEINSRIWHLRLGRPSPQTVKTVLNQCNVFISNDCDSSVICEVCQKGKIHRLPFKPVSIKANQPLMVVHSNVWGLVPILSSISYRYYVAFTNKCTR